MVDSDEDYARGARLASARLLGLEEDACPPSRAYIDVPAPLHQGLVRDLLGHLEQRHARPWWEALVTSRATEYMTYGLYAEHVDRSGRVAPTELGLSRLVYSPAGGDVLAAIRAVAASGAAIAMVHSLLPVTDDDLSRAARTVWGPE